MRPQVHPPTSKDISTNGDEHKVGQARSNPYALFLKKPRRKVRRRENIIDLTRWNPRVWLRAIVHVPRLNSSKFNSPAGCHLASFNSDRSQRLRSWCHSWNESKKYYGQDMPWFLSVVACFRRHRQSHRRGGPQRYVRNWLYSRRQQNDTGIWEQSAWTHNVSCSSDNGVTS